MRVQIIIIIIVIIIVIIIIIIICSEFLQAWSVVSETHQWHLRVFTANKNTA